MEFVIIQGDSRGNEQPLAQRMRAHGYHYLSPELFFVDDFGDRHFDAERLADAQDWCRQTACRQIAQHHDIVLAGLGVDRHLIRTAEQEGYHVAVIQMNREDDAVCAARVEALIRQHEQDNPSLLARLTRQIFS